MSVVITNEKDVIICCLKKEQNKKAFPLSAYFEDIDYECLDDCNHLNIMEFVGRPGIFWINRGYEVYSVLTEDKHWFQYCFSSKNKIEKQKDLSEYRIEFIPSFEHEMCTVKSCEAYLTFDDCVHTLPKELHYMVIDYI